MLLPKFCDVAVIIPHYNSVATLIRAIDSVLAQTLLPKQIIVVDDASPNAHEVKQALVETYQPYLDDQQLLIEWLPKNQGVAIARNIGIALATADYIAFLDSDDAWHPQKLAIQYDFMQKNNVSFSFHQYLNDLNQADNSQRFNQTITLPVSTKEVPRATFIYTNPIATPTVMAKKATFITFNTQLKRMEDYECWVKNSQNLPIFCIESALATGFKPPLGHSGLSGNVQAMHQDLLNALKNLYRGKMISLPFFGMAYMIETLKYPLRIMKIKKVKP